MNKSVAIQQLFAMKYIPIYQPWQYVLGEMHSAVQWPLAAWGSMGGRAWCARRVGRARRRKWRGRVREGATKPSSVCVRRRAAQRAIGMPCVDLFLDQGTCGPIMTMYRIKTILDWCNKNHILHHNLALSIHCNSTTCILHKKSIVTQPNFCDAIISTYCI